MLVAALALGVLAAPGVSKGLPWKIVLARDGEPGEPLVVSGTVHAPDGVTPAPGVVLSIHQTDAEGHYVPRWSLSRTPRLRGQLATSADGRYEFRTIKPGSYPGRQTPAHIHFKASGGYPEQYPEDLLFAGDPKLPADVVARAAQAGKFNFICAPARDAAGLLHCVYNIKLTRQAHTLE